MMKNKIFVMLFLFFMSCKEEKKQSCKNINVFNFPKDINVMINNKQICNTLSNKWGDDFKLEYDDDNFALLAYNEKIKIFIDKKKEMIICIKSNEANNFDVLYNEKDNFIYGINELVYLDENLMPIYSIGHTGVYKYVNDLKNMQTKYCRIDDNEITFETLNYSQILSIFSKLRNDENTENKDCQISPYYKNPYSWEL